MNDPIFIVGANRSGTTLLRLILNAHSRIGIPDEVAYFNSHFAGVPIERWRTPGLETREYRAFVERFLARICATLQLADCGTVEREVLENGPYDFRRPYQLVLEHWARQHGKERWGEKTPGNLFYVDAIREMFPDARFIHMVRDPRAGVSSMRRTSFLADDVIINALNRQKYMREGLKQQARMASTGTWMQVRYEDLVTQPERIVRALCEFLREVFEPDMLNFHRDAERFMNPKAADDFNQAATQPIVKSKSESWQDELTAREVAAIETICGDSMQAFGYEPVGRPAHPTTWADIALKLAYYRLQCWRHRTSPQYLLKERVFARSRNRVSKAIGFFSRASSTSS
jgi:hypothetical protein